MQVELLHSTPISTVIKAIRTCYDSNGSSDSGVDYTDGINNFKLGPKDSELIGRILSSGHDSTIEHAVYTFAIEGISRGCLQELARHRISSFSVKSTRYTLGRIKKAMPFFVDVIAFDHAFEYLVECADEEVNKAACVALENVRALAVMGVPNDQLKYCLPEAFKTSLVWTINARSLRNFLKLRLGSGAHWEIKKLASEIKKVLPIDHNILFQ